MIEVERLILARLPLSHPQAKFSITTFSFSDVRFGKKRKIMKTITENNQQQGQRDDDIKQEIKTIMMISQLKQLRLFLFVFLFFFISFAVSVVVEQKPAQRVALKQECSSSDNDAGVADYSYYHLVVLVHGYMGSDKEQSYLGETLIRQFPSILQKHQEEVRKENDKGGTTDSSNNHPQHKFVVLSSKANVGKTTDGVAAGGKRLASEITNWIQEYSTILQKQEQKEHHEIVMTLSLIGNSLGGLYSRYALSELQLEQAPHPVIPLIFCTTSSPHMGVSKETFIKIPDWAEKVAAMAMQQTGEDLFGNPNKKNPEQPSLVTNEMCLKERYLSPLREFQKRITVANAYNTDFLVSVSSAAFLSADSDSIHYRVFNDTNTETTSSNRLIQNEHAVLHVATPTEGSNMNDDVDLVNSTSSNRSKCTESLDRLGWHKIFMDTRADLPEWTLLDTPDKIKLDHPEYTSKELREHFARYGTLLPIAHPLNMANSKTDWYGILTQKGRPIMDALAKLLIWDLIELSESTTIATCTDFYQKEDINNNVDESEL